MTLFEEHGNTSIFTTEGLGERLDTFAARRSGESRARIQRLIRHGGVLVNGAPAKANYKVRPGDDVALSIGPPEIAEAKPQDIPIQIICQDADICVVNKAQGMVVHPAPGHADGTLVNALLYALDDLSGIGGAARPGIVHRIDKMTSGLLVVAKNDRAHRSLAAQIKAHTARRFYLALVEGNMEEDEGFVDAPIGRLPADRKRMAVVQTGREARTDYKVLSRMERYTLIEAALATGRTHQIRVHMAHQKHPLAGDTVYGRAKPQLGLRGQALHAYKLVLRHPATDQELCFYAPPPQYFLDALYKANWDGVKTWNDGQ